MGQVPRSSRPDAKLLDVGAYIIDIYDDIKIVNSKIVSVTLPTVVKGTCLKTYLKLACVPERT